MCDLGYSNIDIPLSSNMMIMIEKSAVSLFHVHCPMHVPFSHLVSNDLLLKPDLIIAFIKILDTVDSGPELVELYYSQGHYTIEFCFNYNLPMNMF